MLTLEVHTLLFMQLLKGNVLSIAKTLSGELKDRGIRVNAIRPGPISTPFYDKLELEGEAHDEMSKGLLQQIPMGRMGTSQEIANAVLFLASDDSSFMLGSEVIVDGGMSTL